MDSERSGSYTLNTLECPAEERARLRMQAEWQGKEEIAFLKAAGAVPGARVLDLGCGGGEISRCLSRLVAPGGSVVGVDRDPAILSGNGDDSSLRFNVGLAGELDESLGLFDLIYARFLLQHVTDPEGVVNNAAGRLRPGGRMALLDSDDGLILSDPMDAELLELLTRAEVAQHAAGGNRRVGRRLVGLMAGAGLKVDTARVQMFTSVETPFPFLYRLATGYKAALIGESERFGRIGQRLANRVADGSFFFSVGVCLAIGLNRQCIQSV